jgi:tetratricopeptide (TPR) repeat protein
MKNAVIIFTAIAFLFISCNNKQTSSEQTGASVIDANIKLYEHAMKAKDFQTAITAIQYILLEDSTHQFRDSLPELFGAVNNLEACLMATESAMIRYPDNEKYKTIMLICLQQIGDFEGQTVLLNDLYQQTKKPEYVIQIVTMLIQTGQLKQASKTIDELMKEFKNSKESIEVAKDENSKQRVPIMAALWNMKGYTYLQMKNVDKAKEAFFKALEIDDKFEMPKRNLNMIFDNRMR